MTTSNATIPDLRLCRWTPEVVAVPTLTALLHRAYAPLAAAGHRFFASHQSDSDTLQRLSDGEGWVALLDGQPVATVTFYDCTRTSGCAWYDRADVACFGQFCVDPPLQGRGIGSSLIDMIERRAHESGAAEIACDTAEGASGLRSFYERRGYRWVGFAQWSVTNYRSVVLSKRCTPSL